MEQKRGEYKIRDVLDKFNNQQQNIASLETKIVQTNISIKHQETRIQELHDELESLQLLNFQLQAVGISSKFRVLIKKQDFSGANELIKLVSSDIDREKVISAAMLQDLCDKEIFADNLMKMHKERLKTLTATLNDIVCQCQEEGKRLHVELQNCKRQEKSQQSSTITS